MGPSFATSRNEFELTPQIQTASTLIRRNTFYGMIDYNKTDFAPPHEKPSQRQTWAPNGQHGYSLGPAMHHFKCQNVYISSTFSERIVETLEFFPHNSPMPQVL
jgi:hypothetical protein